MELSLDERIKLFIQWEYENIEYLLDLAQLVEAGEFSPEAVEKRIKHLTGQEWMLFQTIAMLGEVYRHSKKQMETVLNEASSGVKPKRKTSTKSKKHGSVDVKNTP